MAIDRLEQLRAQNVLTGIDFIYVDPSQQVLDVFFLTDPLALVQPLNLAPNDLKAADLRIHAPSGGETLPEVPITAVSWQVNDGRNVLRVLTSQPGDFSLYRFVITDPADRIDRYFNDVSFWFKANCPSELDCAPPPHLCPPDEIVDFPIDYRARDFWSFRQALLDFASQRYPKWQDRLEADIGIMLAEVMSAMGDDFTYARDRVGREAHIETASQRRSLRRHARLVDYELDDGRGARTWLDFTVDGAFAGGPIPAGVQVFDINRQLLFEVGRGLRDQDPDLHLGSIAAGRSFAVRRAINERPAYIWDEDDTCLPVGSTTVYVLGHHAADLAFDDPPEAPAGKWVLLKTNPKSANVPARRWPVRLTQVQDTADKLTATNLTRLVWQESEATPFELDLETLVMRGNLVPASAGESRRSVFRIGTAGGAGEPAAIERVGPNQSAALLHSLAETDEKGLVWFVERSGLSRPEVRLFEATDIGGQYDNGFEWQWRRSFVGVNSSQSSDFVFTLDDGQWRRIVGYRRNGGEIVHEDYASGLGSTIRFADPEFGFTPSQNALFQAVYRVGNGLRTNVAADSLVFFDAAGGGNPALALPFIASVTNPLAARDGADPETADHIRQTAPEAFRAVTFRAVRPEDYGEAAERLDWVQRAGAEFRWTGSWLTAFVTPDPKNSSTVTPVQKRALTEQLDRFRQAGREAYVRRPRYANIDLEIEICVEASSFKGDVKERVLEALFGVQGIRPRPGFFSSDNFTFGTPLERSALEAAIQEVGGVRAVEEIRIRRRGWFAMRPFDELFYRPADNEVVRVENDRLLPEYGAVKLIMEGGA